MRVVLLQNMLYVPTRGGANVSNRLILEAMADQGHDCTAIVPAFGPGAAVTNESAFLDALGARALSPRRTASGTYVFASDGVTVHAVLPTASQNVMTGLYQTVERVTDADTDWLLVSNDDGGTMLLEAAHRVCPGRVVALARTCTSLPFGPYAPTRNPTGVRLMKQCAAVLANSSYMQRALADWGGVDAVSSAMTPFDEGPHPNFASFDAGYVTMINPCDLKGIALFLALADRFPDVDFAAVPTWGTTASDRAALQKRPNVTLLDPVDDIDRIYAQTRILLMPSLWVETFGRCATEAMQRGLPVLASDHGGLPEAKGGVEYLLPVRPIPSVTHDVSDRGRVVPETVPEQDVAPWTDALRRLLTDRAHYDAVSRRSREAAAAVARANRPERVGELLQTLTPTDAASSDAGADASKDASANLSDDERRLLALRALRQQHLR